MHEFERYESYTHNKASLAFKYSKISRWQCIELLMKINQFVGNFEITTDVYLPLGVIIYTKNKFNRIRVLYANRFDFVARN